MMPLIGDPRSEIVALIGLGILRSQDESQVVPAVLHHLQGVSDGEKEVWVVVIAVPAGLDPELDRPRCAPEISRGSVVKAIGAIDKDSGSCDSALERQA